MCVCVLLVVLLVSVAFFKDVAFFENKKSVNTVSAKQTYKTIIIDAGHGGFDGGAVASDGTIEKDLNLEISLKLNAVLKAMGYRTVLVRDADLSMEDDDVSGSKKVSDMKNRLKLMKSHPDSLFVSIHMNKYQTSQPNGTQVFYGLTDGSQSLANFIQSAVKQNLQPNNHRVVKKTTKDIYLLYNSVVPSVIVECGFLSNPNDLANLKSQDYQKSLSWAIAEGIMRYFSEQNT